METGFRSIQSGLYDPSFEHDNCGVGFVANITGKKSHDIIDRGLEVLVNLTHRGASGRDPDTGDGAGILLQIPDEFFRKACASLPFDLPGSGQYGVGMVFFPTDVKQGEGLEKLVEQKVKDEGQTVLGWRTVPTYGRTIGHVARYTMPVIRQVFIARSPDIDSIDVFERKLFIIRKVIEKAVSETPDYGYFYIPTLSCKTIGYKGLLHAHQVKAFYTDLNDSDMKSAIALVHQRYSTNTFPTWDLGQPFRYLAHNGEINTLRGNVNWMYTRQSMFESELFGDDIKKLFPVCTQGASDSANLDNVLELLVLSGRPLDHAVMMLIPEAWENHKTMSREKRDFYQYHSSLIEPWDGPASIAFTDGRQIGAVLDRNGLRPSRFVVTKDDFCVMASEMGVLEIDPENIKLKGRLQPGKILLIDTEEGRIIDDEEIKHKRAIHQPYGQWLRENRVTLDDLPEPSEPLPVEDDSIYQRQRAFGYTEDDLKFLIGPMARDGKEPTGSMGNDTPLAVLSNRPQLLYNYFKQLFAQVTNPPIDPIREDLVMSLKTFIGRERNLLDESPEHCHRLQLPQPILTNEDLAKIRHAPEDRIKSVTLKTLFNREDGEAGLKKALDRLCGEASQAIADGATIVILSDRGMNEDWIPIPALLANSAVHHHLIREGGRAKAGLITESGEPREVMHFALLAGYGSGAINPYLAFETIEWMIDDGRIEKIKDKNLAIANYIGAIGKGLLKVISKMGISTLQSYRGAQIFEAVGIGKDVIDEYFTWTASRLDGIPLKTIAKEAMMRHEHGYHQDIVFFSDLDRGGYYQWRRDGEKHAIDPDLISKLQHAVRENSYESFKAFSRLANGVDKDRLAIRSLLKFKGGANPIPLDEIEPASEIVKRFVTGAMSFGSISKEAHETLAIAMNRLGGKSNTGEGGEDPERFKPLPSGDSKRSAIKQVASGRFGVTIEYLTNADELQIKMAQGAKPGEGGQLPGHKVDEAIGRVRHSTPGVTLISPPPHHDIYSIEDLAQLIHDLKNSNPAARISVKLVAEVGVGTVAAGVSKGHSDHVLISGDSGGTGASPLTSIKHAGLPWELGLSEAQQVLVRNDLRSRIVVQTDGQLKTGRDVAIAACLGAEEMGFATLPLIASGCIMMRKCHLNTCPVGIATQNTELRKRYSGKPEHIVNFFLFVAEEVREIMAQLGIKKMDDMIGCFDLLEPDESFDHWKGKYLNLSAILEKPDVPFMTRCTENQEHGLDKALDNQLFELAHEALEHRTQVEIDLPIYNTNRTVGTMLSHEVTKRYTLDGLPDDTIRVNFTGSAGQSFAAFLANGISMTVVGDANDYVCKGMSGGRVAIYPPEASTFVPEENILIGNVALYGATGGECYFRGVAGERFCVRNSGAWAVVEGVGDHACEYMTGGRAVILGPTGRNFAAGMSGGIAYVYDPDGAFPTLCNRKMVDLGRISDDESIEELQEMIQNHFEYTKSTVAEKILDHWEACLPQFVEIMPKEYKRYLTEKTEQVRLEGLEEVSHG